jgi:hypothetical protein
MSIERDGRRFVLICDEYGEQHVELDFNLAVEFKRERKHGWRAVRSGEGWADLCPDCAAGAFSATGGDGVGARFIAPSPNRANHKGRDKSRPYGGYQ